MELLDQESFLKQLAALFEASKEHGTVWLTHKRLSYEGEDASAMKVDENEGSSSSREYPCLLRCTNGKEVNISTTITSGQLPTFNAAYGALLKSAMNTLRKRDKKREKTKTDQTTQRKKRMAIDVPIDGPKRGNGRKKRQRQIKASLKQEEARASFEKREAGKAVVAK